MNVWTAPWSTVMLETKYLRLATAVTLGSRFGDWCVCWRAAGADTGSSTWSC